jgi:hypothetical protein
VVTHFGLTSIFEIDLFLISKEFITLLFLESYYPGSIIPFAVDSFSPTKILFVCISIIDFECSKPLVSYD